jgi:hypothetical protein
MCGARLIEDEPPPTPPQPTVDQSAVAAPRDPAARWAATVERIVAHPVQFGVAFAVALVVLAGSVALVTRRDAPAGPTWGTQATPLGQAMVELPTDCRVTPPVTSKEGRLGAVDCWLDSNSEIAVLEAQLSSGTKDVAGAGSKMVAQMIGGSIDSVQALSASRGTASSIVAHGKVAGRPATLKGRMYVVDGDLLIVVGLGLDKVPVPQRLGRVLGSIQLS